VPDRKFVPTRTEDTFELGRLEGGSFSGVYLSPAYMDRLREVMYAAELRLDAAGDAAVPDAVKNLIEIVKRLTRTHAEQLKVEGYPWTDADRANLARAEKAVQDALEALRRFHPPSDDPDDA